MVSVHVRHVVVLLMVHRTQYVKSSGTSLCDDHATDHVVRKQEAPTTKQRAWPTTTLAY